MPEDEIPAEWMWHLDHELDAWFDEVARKRKERLGGGGDDDDRTEVPMMQNELAAEKRQHGR